MKSELIYLQHILDAIAQIKEYVRNKPFSEFMQTSNVSRICMPFNMVLKMREYRAIE